MTLISKRSELIFLYDTKLCNPNGDPMEGNKPRIDEETGKCLVTDVRLKRTIRDYLFDKGYNGKADGLGDIFIRDDDNGNVQTGTARAKAYKDKADFINKFIDVRLFGGVSAAKKEDKGKGANKEEKEVKEEKSKTFNLTGPVQFGMGKSLHPVKVNFIKGTGAFSTSETAQQRTFREEYNISYGLIGFHGVINENAAVHSQLTEADVTELLDAMWNGTKNLLTRSKKGHMPRLLLKIDYSTPNFFIGDLLERLVLDTTKRYEALEDVSDYVIDISQLNKQLEKYDDKIAHITIWQDDRLQLSEPIKTK